MSSEIIDYLRNTNDIALIQRIIQELNKNQPEVKGDAAQERIVKTGEVVEKTQVITNRRGDAILLENGTDYLLTESDARIYLEIGNY